jgi:hypothetical protein
MTEWKPIKTHLTYQVSRCGQIRNSRGKILARTRVMNGLSVAVSENAVRSNLRVARVVGEAFCEDFNQYKAPIFLDGDFRNCHASNLKWVPRSAVRGKPYSKNKKVI